MDTQSIFVLLLVLIIVIAVMYLAMRQPSPAQRGGALNHVYGRGEDADDDVYGAKEECGDPDNIAQYFE
jgi:hypothetical protein